LERYAFPVLGKRPVEDIDLPAVESVLAPIWLERTETAKRLRGRIESVLSWAIASGKREGPNPARWRGNLDAVLAKPSKVSKVQHHRALPWKEIGRFMADLRQRQGMAARALEFAILTAARSGEVRFAVWSEIDLEARCWTIPAERMKAGREHCVPLSAPALALLAALPRMEGSPYVFAAPRGGALSDMSISAVCRRMEVDAVPHGFRSTFRDWTAESTAYARDVAEMALAHTIPNAVEAAYRRGTLFDKRVRLMRDWAAFCGEISTPAEVRGIQEAKRPNR
jgi:integrase